jgi:hypothetical protein
MSIPTFNQNNEEKYSVKHQTTGYFMPGFVPTKQERREELRAGGRYFKNGRKMWSKATALGSSQNLVGVM